MKIIGDYKNCPFAAKGGVVAIGNFDGVHKGHVAVIEKAKQIAATYGAASAVLTFSPHPLKILKPEIQPFYLTTKEQKYRLISELGVEYLFEINFDKEFSQITADFFIQEILLKQLGARHIITGEDFIFGHNREGNVNTLAKAAAEYGFDYTKVAHIGSDKDVFSSSLARRSLKEPNLDQVQNILGRNFVISGVVEQGKQQGRILGFPTINIDLAEYIRPAFGVFAAKIYIDNRLEPLLGAANIGIKPTVNGTKELLEVHIFNFSENIYGHKVSVELIGYVREERKFESLDALKTQIAEDCKKIKEQVGGI